MKLDALQFIGGMPSRDDQKSSSWMITQIHFIGHIILTLYVKMQNYTHRGRRVLALHHKDGKERE